MAEQAKETKAKETKAKEPKCGDTEKVYKFKSENKFLSCVALGVQFINGTASTTNLAVARALAKIDGVTLVED